MAENDYPKRRSIAPMQRSVPKMTHARTVHVRIWREICDDGWQLKEKGRPVPNESHFLVALAALP